MTEEVNGTFSLNEGVNSHQHLCLNPRMQKYQMRKKIFMKYEDVAQRKNKVMYVSSLTHFISVYFKQKSHI